MQMLWLLSGLGAAVLCSGSGRRGHGVAALAGFGVGAWLLRGVASLDPAAWAWMAAAAAGARLLRPGWVLPSAFCGGILAAVLGALLRGEGVPGAWGLAAAVPGVAVLLSARARRFAPAAMVEEASILILILGVGTAVVPAVIDGWRSAGALTAAAEAARVTVPVWALGAAATSLLVGALWSLRGRA